METHEIVEKLVKIGGSEWKKNQMHRVYFNDFSERLGLHVEHYNTGNISGATLNGERISNSEAKRIIGRLNELKVWYDMTTGKLMFKNDATEGVTEEERKIITKGLWKQINEAGIPL